MQLLLILTFHNQDKTSITLKQTILKQLNCKIKLEKYLLSIEIYGRDLVVMMTSMIKCGAMIIEVEQCSMNWHMLLL